MGRHELDPGGYNRSWPAIFSRDGHDSARGVTVLFGGFDLTTFAVGDTWKWDGTSWTQVATTGPGPRVHHAMAHDSARGVTVLFATTVGDTWEWDGLNWTLVATTGPGPRFDHAMTYDSARGVTVLFGGAEPIFGLAFGDTWEFAAVGPPAVGGTVTGLTPLGVLCWNLTTGQQIIVPSGSLTWNCNDLGLVVTPGDRILTGAVGDVP